MDWDVLAVAKLVVAPQGEEDVARHDEEDQGDDCRHHQGLELAGMRESH